MGNRTRTTCVLRSRCNYITRSSSASSGDAVHPQTQPATTTGAACFIPQIPRVFSFTCTEGDPHALRARMVPLPCVTTFRIRTAFESSSTTSRRLKPPPGPNSRTAARRRRPAPDTAAQTGHQHHNLEARREHQPELQPLQGLLRDGRPRLGILVGLEKIVVQRRAHGVQPGERARRPEKDGELQVPALAHQRSVLRGCSRLRSLGPLRRVHCVALVGRAVPAAGLVSTTSRARCRADEGVCLSTPPCVVELPLHFRRARAGPLPTRTTSASRTSAPRNTSPPCGRRRAGNCARGRGRRRGNCARRTPTTALPGRCRRASVLVAVRTRRCSPAGAAGAPAPRTTTMFLRPVSPGGCSCVLQISFSGRSRSAGAGRSARRRGRGSFDAGIFAGTRGQKIMLRRSCGYFIPFRLSCVGCTASRTGKEADRRELLERRSR